MSGSNPFDRVRKQRKEVRSFQEASEETKRTVANAARRVEATGHVVYQRLIQGKAYEELPPRSKEKIGQDLLDDQRFRDLGRNDIQTLPTAEERTRAARSLARRDPLIDEAMGEAIASDVEVQLRREGRRTATVFLIWAWTLFCFIAGVGMGKGLFVAIGVAIFGNLAAVLLLRCLSLFVGLGTVSGKAV
jgi:hypothetical protein